MSYFGGIEGGGTKFVCAIGSGPDAFLDELRYPTTTPEATLGQAIAFFRSALARGVAVDAVGIASFGPVDPDPKSPTFGYITTTPKAGWAHVDFAGTIAKALAVPVGFDTDVNAAALGEYTWGAAQGLESCLYLTVGTGIGGGGVINGKMIHGMMHPEMGHVRIPHDLERDPFPGNCPYHGDCLEGLASGPAMEARWGRRAESLPADHPAWALEAHYLALGLVSYIVTLSPQRIVLGGGVMDQPHLIGMVRRDVQALLNGYIRTPAIVDEIDTYIVPAALGRRAGVLGAIALARQSVLS